MADESARPCPACGGDVPAGAEFCLHCGESLRGEHGTRTGTVDGPGSDVPAGGDSAATEVDPDAIAAARGGSRSDDLSDSSLVAIVAIVAGLLLGMLAFFAYGVLSGDLGVVLLLAVWIAGMAVVARRRGVLRGARDGAYALATMLVVVPAGVTVIAAATGSDRVGSLAVLVVPMVVAAALVAGVGYFAGDRIAA